MIIQLVNKPHIIPVEDEAFIAEQRKVAMVYQNNLVCLDKALAAARRAEKTSYAAASARCGSIGEFAVRAIGQVKDMMS